MTAPGPVITLDALGEAAGALVAAAGSIEGPAWLVGGTLRDLQLGRPVHDLDLALPGGSLAAARRLADRLGGAFVPIGAAHGVARVVVSAHGGSGPAIRLDLADFRGPGLEADLRGRDVTIHALAAPLGELAAGTAGVVDPLGGLADLAAGLLRACGPSAFVDDPVRVLRLLRFAHGLGFRIEERTGRLARAAASSVTTVSPERVRDELTEVLRLSRTAPAVRQADDWSVVDALLPEAAAMRATPQSPPHHFDVWEHSLRALEAADALLADLDLLEPHGSRLEVLLAEDLGTGLTRREVLKLAVLLHDVAKPETRSVDPDGRVRFIGHDRLGAGRVRRIAERLAWPGRATEVLVRLVRQHLRPMHLGMLRTISARARYRFYRDVGDEVPALVCLTIADAAGTDGRPAGLVYRGATRDLLAGLLVGQAEAARESAAPPLLRGEDVMAAFGLSPGPPVGRLLRQSREAQALGLVGTREEALAWLARQPGSEPAGGPPTDVDADASVDGDVDGD